MRREVKKTIQKKRENTRRYVREEKMNGGKS